jgi:pimeloyl-ACP methyl ester carboxylesterase
VLEDIVTGLHLPPAIFIGNSVGGFAAARLAIRLPEHVKGLVLVGTGGFVPWTWFLKLFTRLLGIEWVTKLIFPSLVRRYMSPQNTGDRLITTRVSELAKTVEGSKIAASLFRSFLDPSYDLRSVASEIKAPTLIVWGKRDLAVPLNIGHATHKAIESSRFEVLDAGHVVFASKPAEFLTVAESFIQECFTVNASTEM